MHGIPVWPSEKMGGCHPSSLPSLPPPLHAFSILVVLPCPLIPTLSPPLAPSLVRRVWPLCCKSHWPIFPLYPGHYRLDDQRQAICGNQLENCPVFSLFFPGFFPRDPPLVDPRQLCYLLSFVPHRMQKLPSGDAWVLFPTMVTRFWLLRAS